METKTLLKKTLIVITFVGIFSLTVISSAKADSLQPNQPLKGSNAQQEQISSLEQNSLALPAAGKFVTITEAIAFSINRVNLSQENGILDESDLGEDFNHFSYAKYQEVLAGKRSYRYLTFQPYWDDFSTDVPHIRIIVNISDSENNENEVQYLDEILDTLERQYKVNTSLIDNQQKEQIIKDIANGNRLSCVKSLRLVWALFAPNASEKNGLFPEIFELNIVKAGELVNYVQNGENMFSVPNMLQPVSLQNTIATNVEPSTRPELFEKKVVVFFRPVLNSLDTGHVGIGWVTTAGAEGTTITTFEVNGETGMAHYESKIQFNNFRERLYSILTSAQSSKVYVGWLLNL